jgi:cytochrome c biogenesis protein CcmG/thiol:disulfide interchange protein DsbE
MPTAPFRRTACAVFLLAAGCAGMAAAKDAQLRPWPASQPAPALDTVDLAGQPWQLAGLRGKVAVVNFWASWCEPCVAELPVLAALAKRDGVAVVGVNYKESLDTIERFKAAHPIPYPVLRDRTGDLFKAWSPGVMPATIVLDRQGRARWRTVGEIPADDTRLRAAIDALLAEPVTNHHQK